jgi:putative transposase
MPYNPDVHHRRSIRLKEYDYTQSGAYFVTIVTYQREPLFGEIVDGAMNLNSLGEIARREWFKTAELRPYVELYEDEFVVMPNHAHGIIWNNGNPIVRAERRSAPTDGIAENEKPHVDAGSLGAIVRAYKSAVTYAINAARQTRGTTVWHRNYHEHIIRDDADLKRIRDYIANNPLKWTEDSLR